MMIDEAACRSSSSTPSIAAYNIRFLSLSSGQHNQWARKLANVRRLASQYTLTGLLETHVDGATADLFFCRHVEGLTNFYADGFAVLASSVWADLFKPVLRVVVPDAVVAMCWESEGIRHTVFFLRLDAHSEGKRCEQLDLASAWARARVRVGDWVAFAGDRNFVRVSEERSSASQRPWRPSERMNRAWERWLHAAGDAQEVEQPEFFHGVALYRAKAQRRRGPMKCWMSSAQMAPPVARNFKHLHAVVMIYRTPELLIIGQLAYVGWIPQSGGQGSHVRRRSCSAAFQSGCSGTLIS